MQTLGVDVARAGWVAVALEDGRFAEAAVERMFAALLARFPDATVVAVDVPIGLPKVGERRRADLEARTVVEPRRSSVFLTPPAEALAQPTYGRAREVAPGTSAQAWALGRAILQVQRVEDDRVHEAHPEVSFATFAGRPLMFSKKTWNGHRERFMLLERAGITVPDRIDAGLVGADDVLDAAAAAWTATRIARGAHGTLPADARRGEPVIHY